MVDQPIPLAAQDSCVAIVGRTGSGKTTAARGAVEMLLDASRQVVVIDPTGVWWGLRILAASGAGGFPIEVLGGDHSDVPLSPDSGAAVASLIVDRRLSVVLDTSLMTMGERRRFYQPLLETLYQRNRAPLHLVVDEADELAPQKPLPDQTVVLNRMEQIVRRGRSRGFRSLLITQRPAVLNKNCLSQAGLLVAMQLTAAQDRAAIGAWIEGQADRAEAKELLAALPKLGRGEGYVWWPTRGGPQLQAFPQARSFDSGRAPEAGEQLPALPTSTAWLRDALKTSAPEEKPKPKQWTAELRRAEEAGYERGRAEGQAQRDRLRASIKAISDCLGPLSVHVAKALGGEVIELSARASEAVAQNLISPPAPTSTLREAAQRATRRGTALTGPARRTKGERHAAGGAHMRILRVLAQRFPAALTMAQWATMSRMSRKGGTWANYLSKLRTAGYLEQDGQLFRASSAGLEAAEVVPAEPATPAEIRAQWSEALGSGPTKLIEALLRVGARGLNRASLAHEAGIAAGGGTFANYLSKLRTNGLIRDEGGNLVLVEELRS